MKRISAFSLVLTMLCSVAVAQQNQIRMFAANEEKTVIRVLVNGFDWKTVQTLGGDAKIITLEGGTQINKSGEADLPMLTVMVPAPEGDNLIANDAFNRSNLGTTCFENMTLAVLPGISEPKDKYELKFSDGFSPWVSVKMHEPIMIEGERMVMLNIFPVQYNAEQKKIRLINEMIITIENYEQPVKNSSELAINEPVVSSLTVYPNPSLDILTVSYELESPGTVSLEIYNLAGQTVYSKNRGTQAACLQTATLDVSDFAPGMYSLALRTDKGTSVKRIIVE